MVLGKATLVEIVFFKSEVVAKLMQECLTHFVPEAFRVVLCLVSDIFNIKSDGTGEWIAIVLGIGISRADE
jgi:hypothetical protein